VSAVAPPRTPARLTTVGTAKLPRALLFGIGILYILTGLFDRDPWKTDDVVGLATMLTALENGVWQLPQVGELALAQNGPLATWVGMASIALFGPLLTLWNTPLDATIIASRLPNVLWFGLSTTSVWYGTYLLGRRPEPQPLPLPFGGEPSAQDYGRMLADAALLLLVATGGILWRMHETSFVPALIASYALAFYATARMLERPMSGAITLGLALGAVFLTRGGIGALPMALASLALCLPGAPLASRRRWVALALAIAGLILLAWVLPVHDTYWMRQWRLWHITAFDWPRSFVLLRLLRDLPWFLWPAWPFALLAVWQWRRWLHAPHIAIALAFLLLPLLSMLFLVNVFEADYSLLVVPCAVLAAFALPTLRRGVVNALDWFAVMCFSLAMATVWLGWIAQHTGWPRQIAKNIALQTAGFDAVIVWPALVIACLGTLAWALLVRWRLTHKPRALWRGTVLYAGGIIGTWLLLGTLWMPSLDYARSYRQVAAQLHTALRQHLAPGECVRTQGLGLGQRAAFFVFDRISFSFAPDCPLVLQQTSPRVPRDDRRGGIVLWEGKRAPDRHEMFRLWRILPS